MIARIWGTRGSYPVARAEMLRYGGNTTCAEVQIGDTRIVLDAGTGMRPLGAALEAEPCPPKHIHLLITHTHWDHIIGFPFFQPLFWRDALLEVYGLQRTQRSLRTTIENALSDPLLPFGLEDLRADLVFHELNFDTCFEIESAARITTAQSNHPYRALGYRIETEQGILVFIPDTGPFHTVLFGDERVDWKGEPTAQSEADKQTLEAMQTGIIQLAEGADWLVYDSQFIDAEYARFPHWGHSTPQQALEIAEAAGVRELLLFHHDPHRTDTALDEIVGRTQSIAPRGLQVRAAYEGLELRKGGQQ
jgi:phosphoribosyl 1,2-cyclic phosphodiesterase